MTRYSNFQGNTRLGELCGSPGDISDLNRSTGSGGSPSNLSESFRNLYKDVFNSSLSSCAGSEAAACNAFLSFGNEGIQNAFHGGQELFSPPSSSGGGSMDNSTNRQQHRMLMPSAAECLQSLDMRDFQGNFF